MQYNSQARLYGVRAPRVSQPVNIPYKISARDKAGNVATTGTFYLKVINPNRPPIARIIAQPIAGYSPLKVQFYGDRSYDPDGRIVSYLWNFGDGTTSNQINPVRIYSNSSKIPKYYTVTLTVKDDQGASATTRRTIVVYPLRRR